MLTVLLLTRDENHRDSVLLPLGEAGYATAVMTDPGGLEVLSLKDAPDLVLLDISSLGEREVEEVLASCKGLHLPTLALLPMAALLAYDTAQGADDFLLTDARPVELVSRVRQLLWRLRGRQGQRTIRVGDLLIDQDRYEVSVAGRRVLLTYKEYEVLRLLASAPGRVFTREELLSQVWEYNYFGGTRTVDVHIRRLRSKLEDAHHTFVETVWNVGYRLVEPADAP